MTTVIEVVTVRKTGNIKMPRRIFSLRGCHLIAEIESSNYDATILASKNTAVKINNFN